jgi:hypothetical protein
MNVLARMRKATALGRRMAGTAALGCALAVVLLGPMVDAAWATPEMRGEWRLVSKSERATIEGVAIISQQASPSGEFAASEVTFLGTDPGTFTGTIKGTEASVVLTADATGAFPAAEFTSDSIEVQEGSGSLALTGPGTVTQGSESSSATLTATRVKTYAEVEERLEREQREREEAQERSHVRGEWSLAIEVGSQTVHGVARITQQANAQNEFSSASASFEDGATGSFAGVLEGVKASVTVAVQAAEPYPPSTFTSSSIALDSATEPTSMSGSGTVAVGGTSAPATFTAIRTKNYLQLQEAEAKESAEREAKEKAEREARETAEREAAERAEREAKERLEREATERAAEQAAQAATHAGLPSTAVPTAPASMLAVRLATKTLAVAGSRSVSLPLANPNAVAVQGRIALLLPRSGKATHKRAKQKTLTLGVASFVISPGGQVRVTVKLSKLAGALLARHRALRVLVQVTTKAGGQVGAAKTYALTLRR